MIHFIPVVIFNLGLISTLDLYQCKFVILFIVFTFCSQTQNAGRLGELYKMCVPPPHIYIYITVLSIIFKPSTVFTSCPLILIDA